MVDISLIIEHLHHICAITPGSKYFFKGNEGQSAWKVRNVEKKEKRKKNSNIQFTSESEQNRARCKESQNCTPSTKSIISSHT